MALDSDVRAALGTVNSGQVSDAMEGLGLTRSVLLGYRFLGPEGGKLIGPAFTVRQAAKPAQARHEDVLVSHIKVTTELATPGDVVAIDAGGRTDIGTWGENHCLRSRARDLAGAVVHGATRDAPEIRAMGFPLFCRGASPVASRWDLATVALREPVDMGGVQVCQGDILFGDETGILAIPPAVLPQVVDAALAIRDKERDAARRYER